MIKKILRKLAMTAILIAALVPLINLAVLGFTNLEIDASRDLDYEQLGQVGDFFGGHTAAFSGLISVCLIIYFSTKQIRQQENHFKQQLLISKQTADLSSIENIYDHYDEEYGSNKDSCGILHGIADGHRKWAIRESFSIIDPNGALEGHRKKQVMAEFQRLISLASMEKFGLGNYQELAKLTSSLLLDKRLPDEKRILLWDMYETLRENPEVLTTDGSNLHVRFDECRKRIAEQVEIPTYQ